MERWYLLLHAHDHIWNDREWELEVRVATCNLIRKKMLELDISTLPVAPSALSPNPLNKGKHFPYP